MKAKKSFGQHFLKNKRVLERIAEAATEAPGDVLVEIGPGRGALTEYLARTKKRLVLIEADRDFIDDLTQRFPDARIALGDAAQADYDDIAPEGAWTLVGNLPYNAAAAIVNAAMGAKNPPKELIIMVQKEQAERMRAAAGDTGLLSIVIQLDYDVHKLIDVSPESFSPKPNVDSTVLRLVRKSEVADDRERVIQLAKAAFASRRKQLHKNLTAAGFGDRDAVKAAIAATGLAENARAQELTIQEWVVLAQKF